MGSSSTARYSDGLKLYAPGAAWPPTVARAWPLIASRVAARVLARHAPGPQSSAARRPTPSAPRRSVAAILADPASKRAIKAVARRAGLDEADAAILLSAVPGTPSPEARRTSLALADLVRDLYGAAAAELRGVLALEGRRLTVANRIAIQTRVVHALRRVPAEATGSRDELAAWLNEKAGRAFLERTLRSETAHDGAGLEGFAA